MRIAMMAAADVHGVIGKAGEVPWRLSADLKRLRRCTLDKPVLYGRKTWDSLRGKPLDRRTNIVISRTLAPTAGIVVVRSLDEGLAAAGDAAEAVVLGGGDIYALALPRAQRILLTIVETRVADGDALFPRLPPGDWVADPAATENVPQDEKNQYPSAFYDLWRSPHAGSPFTWDRDAGTVTTSSAVL